MPTDSENVCLWGKTGSHRCPAKTTRLTHKRHSGLTCARTDRVTCSAGRDQTLPLEYCPFFMIQSTTVPPRAKKRYQQTVVSRFGRGLAPDTSVGSLERSGAAAAGNMAGTDDVDAAVIADGAGGPARADTSAEAFADDLAAAHDYRRRAAAGTGRAGADDDPRAV